MEQTTDVIELAKRGSWAQLEYMLENHPNLVFRKDPDDNTPLHWAAKMDHFECVRILIKFKSRLDAVNRAGRTPIMEAAGGATRITFAELYGAEISERLHAGFTGNPLRVCLTEAAKGGNMSVFLFILEHRQLQDVYDKNGLKEALLEAIRFDQRDIVKEILRHNVDVEAGPGIPASHQTAIHDRDEIARMLIEYGVSMHHWNEYEESPLTLAAANNSSRMVSLILHHWATIREASPLRFVHEKNRALRYAVMRSNHGIVAQLFRHEPRPSDGPVYLALHDAIERNNVDMVAVLVRHTRGVDAMNIEGDTPLMAAARRGFGDIVSLLLRNGADASVRDPGGNTAADIAQEFGHEEIAAILWTNGYETYHG